MTFADRTPPRKAAKRPRKPPRVLSEAERHDIRLARAWRQGERYSRNGWVRRPPPRFRATGPRDDAGVACMRAFLRGYDSMTRSRRWRHRASVRVLDLSPEQERPA